MRRLFPIWLILLLAVSGLHAEEPPPKIERWYEITVEGKVVGYKHFIFERSTFEGRPAWLEVNEEIQRLKRDDQVTESTSVETRYCTLDFFPLYLKTIENTEGFEEILEIEYSDTEMTRKLTIAGEVRTRTSKVNREDLQDAGDLIRTRMRNVPDRPNVGDVIPGKAWSGRLRKFFSYTLTMTEVIDDTLYIWESSFERTPGMTVAYVVDNLGEMVELRMPPLMVKECAAEKMDNWEGAEYSVKNHISTDIRIPQPLLTKIDSMVMDITPNRELDVDFPEGLYQDVTRTDRGWTVALKKETYEAVEDVKTLPDTNRILERYLRATPWVQADDPDINGMAEDLIEDTEKTVEAVRALIEWIDENIEDTYEIVTQPSAKEVFEIQRGDCAEHSVLFDAMARSVNIPCRQVFGYVFDGERLVYHAWNEVYLHQWVPIDTTVPVLGAGGRYFAFEFYGVDVDEGAAALKAIRFDCTVDMVAVVIDGRRFECSDPDFLMERGDDPNVPTKFKNVVLHNGDVYPGQICDENDDRIVLHTPFGRGIIQRKAIARIEDTDTLADRRFTHAAFEMIAPDGWRTAEADTIVIGSEVEFGPDDQSAVAALLTREWEGTTAAFLEAFRKERSARTKGFEDLGVTELSIDGVDARRMAASCAIPSLPSYTMEWRTTLSGGHISRCGRRRDRTLIFSTTVCG
jgi:hypothetical protein